MGIVSVGRSLVIRQLLLTGLVIALGAYAYVAMTTIEDMAHFVVAGDRDSIQNGVANIMGATQSAALHVLLATSVAAALMLIVSVPVILFTVGRPVKVLAATIERIANGDLRAEIDGETRNDEIGQIARSLRQIRDALVAREERAVAASRAAEIPEATSRASTEKVEKFSVELAAQMKRLGTMTKRLSDAADAMIVAARHANSGSESATSASTHAAGDVSSVAAASEQLLGSIEEISRQVIQSTNVVKATVERAVETNAGMGRLSTAAQKVGEVVSLISRIAAQTNLLALNATIEAARAGEAGRGFAVVAQEVKTLATQTAKATQDISGQIAEMQEATNLSVDAIDKIQRKISEVEHISTIIASAVHEQGAATQEIARNVRSAAAGTTTMSSHIDNVVRSVGETSASAELVSQLARELDEISDGIDAMVGGFTRSMRAA